MVNNSAVGSNALSNCNTALGYQALISNTSGCNNTAIGYNALYINHIEDKEYISAKEFLETLNMDCEKLNYNSVMYLFNLLNDKEQAKIIASKLKMKAFW